MLANRLSPLIFSDLLWQDAIIIKQSIENNIVNFAFSPGLKYIEIVFLDLDSEGTELGNQIKTF
jgi:hypothetical protein